MKQRSIPHVAGLFDSHIDLHTLLDPLPVGIALLNPNREIVVMNQALEALTGFREPDVKGVPCGYVLRSSLCPFKCPLRGSGRLLDTVCCEGDIVNRDHQRIPVRLSYAPIRSGSGSIKGYLESVEDVRFMRALHGTMGAAYGFGKLIGRSPEMERIFQILPMIAQSDSSVLITGDTGTGKDLLAEAIHQASQRAKGPFIKVNCGALPETLMESELFGHQKGAFTGAIENKPGRFQLAHNGTLYLTEIGDLPLPLQVKLLTFLDDRVIYPLGSTRGFQANVRVVAATHRNLETMVHEGRFRQDLLFRLNVVRLHMPPLRQRQGDVRLLLDHFLNALTEGTQKPVKGFSPKALQVLLEYVYPGNVRELKNITEYALNVCQEEFIAPGHLPAYLTEARTEKVRLPSAEYHGATGVPATMDGPEPALDWGGMERRMIMEALVRASGRKSKAAEILGWGRSTLWRKMKHHRLSTH